MPHRLYGTPPRRAHLYVKAGKAAMHLVIFLSFSSAYKRISIFFKLFFVFFKLFCSTRAPSQQPQ
jgi:hypothetical protein